MPGESRAHFSPHESTFIRAGHRSRRDGSGRLRLTVPPMAVGLFKWSPDSRRLLFVADKAGGREPGVVHLVSRDGGALEAFSDPHGNPVWDPCWLGVGTIAWGNLRGAEAAVWRVDLGSRQVRSLPGSEGMMGAKCAPDGRVLAARAWSQGYWLYRPQTGLWEDLRQPSNLWYPTWARDGQTLYGLSLDERAIYRFRIGRPVREKVADLGTDKLNLFSMNETLAGIYEYFEEDGLKQRGNATAIMI